MTTSEGLTEAEYQDIAVDALLDCGAYCFKDSGNFPGFILALVAVIGVTWYLRAS